MAVVTQSELAGASTPPSTREPSRASVELYWLPSVPVAGSSS
jgi:hypothetical protein